MIITHGGEAKKLPDFMIVGAAKSGTTSLYQYLKNHPQVYMPDKKEPWFFSFMNNPPNFDSPDPLNGVISDIDDYANLFEQAEIWQVIGEASPSYLYTYETAIKNIKKVYEEKYSELKIVIVIRNPADRAFSQYMHFRENLQEPLPFEQAIDRQTINKRLQKNWNIFYDYIGFGMYFKQVESYLKTFNQVKIIDFKDLKNNTEGVVKDTLDFLGVDNSTVPANLNNKYNVSRIARNPVFNFIYKFLLFDETQFKKKLSAFLSEELKKKAESFIKNILLERKKMSPAQKKRVMEIFRKDLQKLEELRESYNTDK